MIVDFFIPFMIPIGVAILGAVVDSVTGEGQQLAHEEGLPPSKRIRRVAFHFGKYMHHIYFGCFAFDLAALVPFKATGETLTSVISYSGKPLTQTLACVALAIVVHMIAYIHTILISRAFAQGSAKRPITHLHLLYFPASVLLLILIRL